jgi:hypothetical protein
MGNVGYAYQCAIILHAVIYYRRNTEKLFFLIAFLYQLLVPGLKDVQVELLTRVYYNAKRKYGNKVRHAFGLQI